MSRLASAFLMAMDPVRFAARAGFSSLDAWQARLLRSDAPRILMNVTRQGGKSQVAAILALHTALYEPGSITLMVSPTQRQSGELFKKAAAMYRALGRPVDATAESAMQLTLDNGSRVVALPGQGGTIRSYSGVSLLLIDEASRVVEDTYVAVRPMLAVSGGRLVALSTPYGSQGWWYEAWHSKEPWERYLVPASECPRISPEFLADEKRSMSRWHFDQEYGCAFLESKSAVFSDEDIQRAFKDDYEVWDLRVPPMPERGAAPATHAFTASGGWDLRLDKDDEEEDLNTRLEKYSVTHYPRR
jgi:hypothetical protein